MNYEDMSDFEINKFVSIRLGVNVPEKLNPWLRKTEFCLHQMNGDGSKIEKTLVKNYCNNPSDAWPIMIDNGVSTILTETRTDDGDLFEAFYMNGHAGFHEGRIHAYTLFSTFDKNPLRAAMICFLRMKDAEL